MRDAMDGLIKAGECYNTKVRIQKNFAFKPRLFFKTAKIIGRVFKCVSSVYDVESLSLYFKNCKSIFKNLCKSK